MKDLHLGLKENLQREGNLAISASIKKLADMFLHEERKNSVCNGQISRLVRQGLFLDLVKSDASIVLGAAGETDEVVTIDVRRQIRCPRRSMVKLECVLPNFHYSVWTMIRATPLML